ncbi:hypothetical protein ACRRTK_014463 [Alexandromys fortis]
MLSSDREGGVNPLESGAAPASLCLRQLRGKTYHMALLSASESPPSAESISTGDMFPSWNTLYLSTSPHSDLRLTMDVFWSEHCLSTSPHSDLRLTMDVFFHREHSVCPPHLPLDCKLFEARNEDGATMLEKVTMLQLGVHLDLQEQCSHRDNNVADAGEKDSQALETYNIEKDSAVYIEKYNPTWLYIVGQNFSNYVVHEIKHSPASARVRQWTGGSSEKVGVSNGTFILPSQEKATALGFKVSTVLLSGKVNRRCHTMAGTGEEAQILL